MLATATPEEVRNYLSGLRTPQHYQRGPRYDYVTGPGYPSGTNTFVPDHQSSGELVVAYSRNPAQFNLPKYVRYIPTKRNVGLFMKLSSQEQIRVVNTTDYMWPDGQNRPQHTDGLEQFQWQYFGTKRYDYGFTIGNMAAEQATWAIIQQHSKIHAVKCMTARTIRMITAATTAGNWATTADPDMSVAHTATATALSGGQFNLGTTTNPYIKIALDKIAVLIVQETAGAVKPSDIYYVMNPNQARLWAESPEIRDYLKGSYWANQEIREGTGPNSRFGLPEKLYGYNIIIEDATRITTRKAAPPAAPTKTFVMPDQKVIAVSRPGSLMGIEGSPDFATLGLFWYKDEMTMQTFNDPKNELTEGHVVENTDEQVLSPLSGYYITATTSVAS